MERYRIISIILCISMFLQALPMEVFASAQTPAVELETAVSQDCVSAGDVQELDSAPQITPDTISKNTTSMYLKFNSFQTQAQYLPNIGNTISSNSYSEEASYRLATKVFSFLHDSQDLVFNIESNSSSVGALQNVAFTAIDVKNLLDNAQLGDVIYATGAKKESHYMVLISASDTSALVYDCNFDKDSKNLIQEHYISYDDFVYYFGQRNQNGLNEINLLRSNYYSDYFEEIDSGFYDDSVNFVITNGAISKYNGSQKIVVVPEGIHTIYSSAFEGNQTINSIVLPDELLDIREFTFESCNNLLGIEIPKSTTNIAASCFANCSNLRHVSFDKAVALKSIGMFAFEKCSSIKQIQLPKNLEFLSRFAFRDCATLQSIFIPKSLGDNDKPDNQNIGPFSNCYELRDVTFEMGTTIIPSYLFSYSSLEEITIPDTVTAIHNNAFLASFDLAQIYFSKNLISIDNTAFKDCLSLEEIEIPDLVTSIGQDAFNGCSSLKRAYLPEHLDTISEGLFNGCTSLEDVILPYNLKQIDFAAFVNCTSLKAIDLPESLTTIQGSAFQDCSSLELVEIPNSVILLGYNAFQNCTSLVNVSLGTGIRQLSDLTFTNCPSIQEIVIPYRVESIQNYAFFFCNGLEKVYIPKGVNFVHPNAFYKCPNVTIYGHEGSAAIQHAIEYDLDYSIVSDNTITAKQINLNKTNLTLLKGSKEGLQLNLVPSNCTQDVTFTSSDSNVASVNQFGEVEAISSGIATITVSVGGKTKTCKVQVLDLVASLKVNEPMMSLEPGEIKQIDLTISPNSIARESLEYIVDDETIVSVDKHGNVTGKKKGDTTITVRTTDGTNLSDQCVVEVLGNEVIVKTLADFQSKHPYENRTRDLYTLTVKGAKEIAVTFSNQTFVEADKDYIYIYNNKNQEVGKYTGNQLAGKKITVKGDTIRVKLITDSGSNEYGFDILSTTPKIPVNPTLVTIDRTSLEMQPGTNTILKATVSPSNSIDKSVLWESTNPDIVSVKDGVLTSHSIGKATITAYSFDKKTSATCSVIVSNFIDGLWVHSIASMVYTSAQIKPSCEVYDGNNLLVHGVDYKVAYKNNINVGNIFSKKPPTAIITGLGNYKGTIKSYFEILPQKINSVHISTQIDNVPFIGKKNQPKPTVMFDNKKLVLNKDYTLTYIDESGTNCVGVKDQTTQIKVVLKGIGNYTGSKTIKYSILGKSLNNATIVKIANQVYTDAEIKPEISVTYKEGKSTTTLKRYNPTTNTGDYKVSYKKNQNVGTAQVTITGVNEYCGSKTVTFKIVPKDVTSAEITVDTSELDNVMYSLEEEHPVIYIAHKERELTEGIDYVVSYKNDKAARDQTSKNPPTVIVKGIGNYTGKLQFTYTIRPIHITESSYQIDVGNAAFNNHKPVKPQIIVQDKYSDDSLKFGRDYTVTYSNNQEIGTAQATIQGIGNYSGSIIKEFQVIESISLKDPDIEVRDLGECMYYGTSVRPGFKLYYDKDLLVQNLDYKISLKNSVNAGDKNSSKPPQLIITGMGAYKDTIIVNYSIRPFTMSENSVFDVSTTDVCYDQGKPRLSKVTVDFNGRLLKKDVDYTVHYDNNKDIHEAGTLGSPTVTITGKGNFDGFIQKTFRIYAKPIESLKYSKIATQIYSGKELKPPVIIYDKDYYLSEGTDYAVTYRNNTKVGYGEIIITGKGTYGGTKKIRFLILPKIFKWFF